MNALSEAVVAAHKAARELAGVEITYSRSGTGSVTLTAVPGDSVITHERDELVVDEAKSRDFIIVASELVISGTQITPQRNDTISESGSTRKVLSLGGEVHWRYTDPTKALIRVHTKEV